MSVDQALTLPFVFSGTPAAAETARQRVLSCPTRRGVRRRRDRRLGQPELALAEELVAAASHELRTPLSHIKGFVSTLRKHDATWAPETRAEFLAEIELEADRLAQLVEDLLDLARTDSTVVGAGRASPTLIQECVAGGLNRVRGAIGQHRINLSVPSNLPSVAADAEQIERVIANLIDNAAKYSPAASTIRVCARQVADVVVVRVEDRGLGIPAGHTELIFEPFFREPAGPYPAKRGSGLGLSICRGIIRAHGGRIWAENRPGGGTTLTFTVPVAGPAAVAPEDCDDAARGGA
jgi:two-component system, OmpR family, sensor histidine kinase KdpD